MSDKCNHNLERGGAEYAKWIYAILPILGWDAKDDVKLYASDELFEKWKRGMSPLSAIEESKKERMEQEEKLKQDARTKKNSKIKS